MRRKIPFLMTLLLSVTMGWAQSTEPELKIPGYWEEGVKGKEKTMRYLKSIELTNSKGEKQTLTLDTDNADLAYFYANKTADFTFTMVAGEEMTCKFVNSGNWINGYVYIDDDKNGILEYGIDDKHFPTGDLYAYSYYSGDDNNDKNGWNSKGIFLGPSSNTLNPPSFFAPAVPGTYVIRFKNDWNSIDPAGDSNEANGNFAKNCGTIIDVKLVVTPAEVVTADVAPGYHLVTCQNEAGQHQYLQIEKNGTLSTTAAPVYSFNITAGAVDGGYAQAGTYTMTMNHQRISTWNGEKFQTVQITEDNAPAELNHSQAMMYNPATHKYAIRCTNVPGKDPKQYIVYKNGQLTAGTLDEAFVWDILQGYPFALTLNHDQPELYAVKTGRFTGDKNNPTEWWLTYDLTDSRIGLRQRDLQAHHVNQFFYFMKNGEQIKIYPLASGRLPLTYLNSGTMPGNVQALEESPSASWVFEVGKDDSHGFKVPGSKSYFGNHGSTVEELTDKKMGLSQWSATQGEPGAKMWFTSVSAEELSAALPLAKEELKSYLLSFEGKVGYPVTAAYNTFKAAVQSSANTLEGYFSDLAAAKTLKTTAAVNMPEAGKAYVLTNMHLNDKQRMSYVNYAPEGLTFVSRGTMQAKELPVTANFICQDLGNGNYALVNNAGKYLVYQGKEVGTNENKGYIDAYDEQFAAMHCQKMTVEGRNTVLFGMMTIGGVIADGKVSANLLVNTEDKLYVSAKNNRGVYDMYNSTAFLLEEVDYANQPQMTAIGTPSAVSIAGAKSIATFSAPFATVIPEGVSAFYIAKDGIMNGKATLTKLEGTVLPAHTGVILTSTDAKVGKVTMVPTTETVAVPNTNALLNTAGEDKTFGAHETFILAKGSKGIGFYLGKAGTLKMNKAYVDRGSLPINATNSLKLVYGDEATGIEEIGTTVNTNAPIYDLSGRRIMNTVKGGIYIQNGKKYIVK